MNRSYPEGEGYRQEEAGLRPGIFPMRSRHCVPVPLETGACAACEAESRARSLSRRPPARRKVTCCKERYPVCVACAGGELLRLWGGVVARR